jgi:hypothetical protein
MLYGVTSTPGQGVWATGQLAMSAPDRQIVLHLVGSTWKVVPEPAVHTRGGAVASADPQAIGLSASGGNTFLSAALAFSPTDVWAVGTYDGSGGEQTLAVHYTG